MWDIYICNCFLDIVVSVFVFGPKKSYRDLYSFSVLVSKPCFGQSLVKTTCAAMLLRILSFKYKNKLHLLT